MSQVKTHPLKPATSACMLQIPKAFAPLMMYVPLAVAIRYGWSRGLHLLHHSAVLSAATTILTQHDPRPPDL
jgi:hypothetical protein